MTLLEIDKLTMRFGGLTAVRDLDLQTAAGSISSVIGPNGAGKTTVFNAVTGIYAPTSGEIRFEGRHVRRPLNWRVWLFCAAVGLFTGLAAALISVDIDQLWRATIVRTYANGQQQHFSLREAWRNFRGYMGAHVAVERVWLGRWAVVPWNSARPLATAANRADAAELAARIDAIDADQLAAEIAADKSADSSNSPQWTIQRRFADSRWQITADDEAFVALAAARNAQRWRERIALPLGLIVGFCGAFVVWNRSRRTPDVIASGGIARTFQNIRLFSSMTVLENVQVAIDRGLRGSARWTLAAAVAWFVVGWLAVWRLLPALAPGRPAAVDVVGELLVFGGSIWLLMLALRRKRRDERESARQAFEGLRLVGLQPKASMLASALAYGEQRRLEIARALALRPRLLLLDEPCAGMNPTEAAELTGLIRRIRDLGVTMLLIEHHMKVVMGISDRVAVLDHGVKIAEGSPAEVRGNPAVIEAYLGKEEGT